MFTPASDDHPPRSAQPAGALWTHEIVAPRSFVTSRTAETSKTSTTARRTADDDGVAALGDGVREPELVPVDCADGDASDEALDEGELVARTDVVGTLARGDALAADDALSVAVARGDVLATDDALPTSLARGDALASGDALSPADEVAVSDTLADALAEPLALADSRTDALAVIVAVASTLGSVAVTVLLDVVDKDSQGLALSSAEDVGVAEAAAEAESAALDDTLARGLELGAAERVASAAVALASVDGEKDCVAAALPASLALGSVVSSALKLGADDGVAASTVALAAAVDEGSPLAAAVLAGLELGVVDADASEEPVASATVTVGDVIGKDEAGAEEAALGDGCGDGVDESRVVADGPGDAITRLVCETDGLAEDEADIEVDGDADGDGDTVTLSLDDGDGVADRLGVGLVDSLPLGDALRLADEDPLDEVSADAAAGAVMPGRSV